MIGIGAMNRLEINATIQILMKRDMLGPDYRRDACKDEIIARIYELCLRYGVPEHEIRREIEAIQRETRSSR